MGSIKLGYKIDPKWSIWMASDYLSGDKIDKDKTTAFYTLYGANHKFYGTMDYFYASPYRTASNPGLWDNQTGIQYKTSGKMEMSLYWHYFSAINNEIIEYDDILVKIKKGLGSELDFQFGWTIMKDVRLTGGYSFIRGTQSMDVIKGGDHKKWQDWFWFSININPQLLFHQWR